MWLGKIYFGNSQIFCKDKLRTGKIFGLRHPSFELIEKNTENVQRVHKLWVFRQDHAYFPEARANSYMLVCCVGSPEKFLQKIWDESKKIMLWEIHSSDVKIQNVHNGWIFVKFGPFIVF